MTENSEQIPKEKKGILLLFSIITFIALPLLIILTVLHLLLTTPEFYTSIIKKSDLITTFIDAKNLQIDKAINSEIEKNVKLTEYKKKFNEIESRYESAKKKYYAINKTEEYNRLTQEKSELEDMEWEHAREIFSSEEMFKKHKEIELMKINNELDLIDKYRDTNEDAIDQAEDTFDDTEDDYEDARSELEDRKAEARDIIEDHKNSLSAKIYRDIEKLDPILTTILNEKLIDRGVQREIKKMINFLSSYEEQKKYNNIFYDTADKGKSKVPKLTIKIPELTLSLWIQEGEGPSSKKRHLLSQVFVDEIRKLNTIQNKSLFITFFRFSDSSLGEYIGESYLKKYGLTLDNGILKFKRKVITGRPAQVLSIIMMVFTYGQYLVIIAPVYLVLTVILFIFSGAGRERKLNYMGRILRVPSIIIICLGIAAVSASKFILNYFPDIIKSDVVRGYVKSIMVISSLHIFIPLAVPFLVMITAGVIMKKISSRNNNTAVPQDI